MKIMKITFCLMVQGDEERTDICFQSFTWDRLSSKISFDMMFLQEGCYQVQVYYSDFLLQNGDFTCVVLNSKLKVDSFILTCTFL